MVSLDYHIQVDSSSEKLWSILQDKVYNPHKYISGVQDCSIKELAPGKLKRNMFRNGIDVIEEIEFDEKNLSTRFVLQNHPNYEGYIYSGVESNGDTVKLKYSLNWHGLNGKEDEQEIKKWFEQTVKDTKMMAEAA